MNLDTPIRDFFEDSSAVNRLVRAMQLDQGASFVDSLDAVHDAADRAVNWGKPTLASLLESAGDADYLSEALTLLERRDQAVERALRDATGTTPAMTPDGMVRLDASADIGALLHDPRERERRLRRARGVDGSYAGDDGRELFEAEDRRYLDADLDLVASLQARAGVRSAQQQAQVVARQLDSAIADAGRERHRLKQLDAKFSKLDAPGVKAARETARDQIREQAHETLVPALKLLDQLEGKDQPSEPDGGLRQLDTSSRTDEVDAEVRERMRRLGRPDTGPWRSVTLEEVWDRKPMPPDKPQAVKPDAAPAGVHADSHAVDQRVRTLMSETGQDYVTCLEQVMREEA